MSACTRCGTAVAADQTASCPDCRVLTHSNRRAVPVEVQVTQAEAATAREHAGDAADKGDVIGHLLDLVSVEVTYTVDGEPMFDDEETEVSP